MKKVYLNPAITIETVGTVTMICASIEKTNVAGMSNANDDSSFDKIESKERRDDSSWDEGGLW